MPRHEVINSYPSMYELSHKLQRDVYAKQENSYASCSSPDDITESEKYESGLESFTSAASSKYSSPATS
eukprot:50735-Hanusia_phi.AAC.1